MGAKSTVIVGGWEDGVEVLEDEEEEWSDSVLTFGVSRPSRFLFLDLSLLLSFSFLSEIHKRIDLDHVMDIDF